MWTISMDQDQGDGRLQPMRAAETLLDQASHLVKAQGVAGANRRAVDLLHSPQRIRGQGGELLGFRGRAVRRQLRSPGHGFDRLDGERRKSATLSAAAPAAVDRRALGRGFSASTVQSKVQSA